MNFMMKRTVSHRCIEQCIDHAPVKGVVVSLESVARLECCADDVIISGVET